jgi:hypothetical protein
MLVAGTFHPPDFTVTAYLSATLYSLTPLPNDGGAIEDILCDSSGLRWTAGVFSQIDGHPFYSLARYLLLQNPVYVPLVVRRLNVICFYSIGFHTTEPRSLQVKTGFGIEIAATAIIQVGVN